MIGIVVRVKQEAGYWFVLHEGIRRFCHISEWSEVTFPKAGDYVEFELGPGRDGRPDQCVRAKPAAIPGAAALATKITTTEIEGVTVVRMTQEG